MSLLVLEGGGGDWKKATSDADVTTGTWTHVVGVMNGTNALMYVNGVIQSIGGACSGITYNSSDVKIGRYGVTTSYGLSGYLDEVRIYDRGLSSNEVFDLYTAEKP